MPIPIIIAILVALFTLGTKMNQPKTAGAKMVVTTGKQIKGIEKKQNHDNLEAAVPQLEESTPTTKEKRQTEEFGNIFQLWGLYRIVNAEP